MSTWRGKVLTGTEHTTRPDHGYPAPRRDSRDRWIARPIDRRPELKGNVLDPVPEFERRSEIGWANARITRLEVTDVRFPTSLSLDGSDAMNPDPDYSAAYVILHTDDPAAPTGHGFTFTTGRGTEVVVAGVEALRSMILGRSIGELRLGMGALWSDLVGDSQLRWIGPEKGVIHLALAAVVNAAWDLVAKAEGKPLWRLLADMTPDEIVECIDFRYIDDAITPSEIAAVVERNHETMADREAILLADGYPAYTTSMGWLGYSDEKIARLCDEALGGWLRALQDEGRRRRG